MANGILFSVEVAKIPATSRTQTATVRDIAMVTKTCLILPVIANDQMIKGSVNEQR